MVIVGDLKYGRTVRSLCYLLGKFENIRITFISPNHLSIKDDIKNYLKKHNIFFEEKSDLNSYLPNADIIYMTRIQKERMLKEEYESARERYKIDKNNLILLKKSSRLMHPLPHAEEISLSSELEQFDSRIAYFRQAENGLYVRMALLLQLLK